MWTWDLDPVLLHGPHPLRFYGLLFGLAVVGAFFLWRWQMRRGGHSEATSAEFLAWGLLAVVLGARLGHCLFYDASFCLDPWFRAFAVWEGGLSSHGATAGLLLALWLFAWRRGLPLAEATDRLSFSAAFGAVLVRVANFFNSEIVGRPTGGTWGVRFPRFEGLPAAACPPRHPVQLYEALLALGVLGVLVGVDRRAREQRRRGLLSALFLLLYFGGRILVERYKEHEVASPFPPFTVGQLLSLAPALAGLVWLVLLARPRTPQSPSADGPS